MITVMTITTITITTLRAIKHSLNVELKTAPTRNDNDNDSVNDKDNDSDNVDNGLTIHDSDSGNDNDNDEDHNNTPSHHKITALGSELWCHSLKSNTILIHDWTLSKQQVIIFRSLPCSKLKGQQQEEQQQERVEQPVVELTISKALGWLGWVL